MADDQLLLLLLFAGGVSISDPGRHLPAAELVVGLRRWFWRGRRERWKVCKARMSGEEVGNI